MDFNELISTSIFFLKNALFLFVPLVLFWLLFNIWLDYVRTKFASSQQYTLLRVYPPKEVLKTPAAMELFINALYQTGGEATPIDVYLKGKSRPIFSLEIASTGGDVGFYVWTLSAFRKYIENQIYAQYPGIEVVEVPDYARQIDYETGNYGMFGFEYGLTQADPVPIKTYVDYGLDQTMLEDDQKTDPITSTLEFLGQLGPGENAWIQIILKAHKKEDKKDGTFFGKTDYWVDQAKEEIKKIRKDSVIENEEGVKIQVQTTSQREKIDAIERNISKLGFDVGIRAIYISEKDSFVGVNIPGLLGSFKQFGSSSLNGFRPVITTSFKYWWQDPFGKRSESLKRQVFNDYQNRVYFGTVIGTEVRKKMVLNTEELATIFHFPGKVAITPGLTRVKSRKSEAPTNLPI